jgi:hypothetical protein
VTSDPNRCARCKRTAPPQDSDDFLYWEALGTDGAEVICPGCITGQEQQAMDEQVMDEQMMDEQMMEPTAGSPAHVTVDDSYRILAQRLVTAEIEDVLTISEYRITPGEQYASVAAEIANDQIAAHVLVETAALAGEVVIRLAHIRGEDPRATLHWLLTTEWTTADDT